MSCQLEESQIQSWLDGECDLSQHLQDCPQCQQRMSAMQRLRARLTPPPSPLGRDFARRTAQHILKVSDKVGPSKPWGVRDNPLVHIVQRERARRMLRAPHPAAVLLLYLLPGSFFFHYGDADARWAYFGMLQIGLTLLVPLLLLSLEWVTLSSLVRGRCLEEILQTGLQPAMLSDTLALNGFRSLLPALLMTGLALLPLHPQSLLLWLPMTLISFASAGYLSQAHLLARNWPRLLTFVGVGAVAGALAAPMPWNLLSGGVLALLGLAARRQSLNSLTAQQQGLPLSRNHRRVWAIQSWLAGRLPELAILQRELQRRNLFGFSVLCGNAGICIASYTMFGWNAYSWPLFAASASLLCAFGLVSREKDGGAFEVLLHSGLQPRDWWRSAQWLSGLQMAPALLAAVLAAAWSHHSLGAFSMLTSALGTACSLLVSLHSGAVIGVNLGLKTNTSRQAASRGVLELALLGLTSLLMVGLIPPLLGQGSPLMVGLRSLGIQLQDALDGFAVLPVALALYVRARSLREVASFNPWTTTLALCLPFCIWLQVLNSPVYYLSKEANFYGGLSLLIGLVWSWWAAPLAQNPSAGRWSALVLVAALAQLSGLPMLVWSLTLFRGTDLSSLPQALQQIDGTQLLALAAAMGWLTYLLGRQRHWRAPNQGSWRLRSAWAGGSALALLVCFGLGIVRLKNAPLAHASEFESFLAQNQQPSGTSWLRQAIRSAKIDEHPYWSSFTSGEISDPDGIRDFLNYKRHQQQFDLLLNQLLQNPKLGKLEDREWALQILEMRSNSHLFHRQPEQLMEDFDQMARFCGQADQLGSRRIRNLCLRLRSRVFLACRCQFLNLRQLSELERILSRLPDDDRHSRGARDRGAAWTYRSLLDSPEVRSNDAITRYYLKQQAELFLDQYLSGQAGRGPRDVASWALWQLSWNVQREADQWKLASSVNLLALQLERARLQTGHYPLGLPKLHGEVRVAYRPSPEGGYYLKAWLSRPSGPMVLVSSGANYKVLEH